MGTIIRLTETEKEDLATELEDASDGINDWDIPDEWESDQAGDFCVFLDSGGNWTLNALYLEGMARVLRKMEERHGVTQPTKIAPVNKPVPPPPGSPAAQHQRIVDTLKEAVLCLGRYCSPGTRGHAAAKEGIDVLASVGVTVSLGWPDAD